MFKLSENSLKVLATVEPSLQGVVKLAITKSKVDFAVVQGGRTLDYQRRLYGKGRNAAQCRAMGVPAAYAQPMLDKVTWIRPEDGNHVIGLNGLGRAVDLVPYYQGAQNWDNSGRLGLWPPIGSAMKAAAKELGVAIKWGGEWDGPLDRPHFELVKS